jgi:transposase
MFTRISRIKMGNKVYEYVRIVESYREKGKKKQRIIANLGTVNSLQGKADSIVEGLRDYCQTKYVKPGEIKADQTPIWGTILVARKLWNDLRLGQIIKKNCPKSKKGPAIEETAFVLAASSLVNPSSEHGLAWWLDKSYVCDSRGKRFLPEWRDQVTKDDRVRVKWEQLKLWYRSLDRLLKAKDAIEKDIYLELRDLFGLKVDIVFYDITSLYFEGEGPDGLAEYGKSKDGKGRNRQILLGVVMASGWPVAHHVFSGNTGEVTTLPEVIADLKNRFQIEKVIFVGDGIFSSKKNLKYLTDEEYKYIAAMKRRRNKEAEKVLKQIKEDTGWEKCGNGTQVQEIEIEEDIRYFVVRSQERAEYERSIRLNNMKTTKEELEALKKSVEKGKTKTREKIGYKVSRILEKVKGYRYFSWKITKGGKFKYWEDPEKMKKEKRIEGVYLLKSNDKTIKPPHAVKAYKELSNVEEAFREFKDVLEGRPIWHQTKDRVQAHVFVRALGYLLDTALRKALKKSNVYLTVEEAIKALQQVTIADLRLKGEPHQIVTGTNKRYVSSILKAVGLTGYKYLLPSQISSYRGKKVAF